MRRVFIEASTERQFQNKWLTDEAWLEIMSDVINEFNLTKILLNKSLSDLHLDPPLPLVMNKKRNICGKRMIYFYFIAQQNCDKRKYTNHNKSRVDIYNSVRIPRKRLKRKPPIVQPQIASLLPEKYGDCK